MQDFLKNENYRGLFSESKSKMNQQKKKENSDFLEKAKQNCCKNEIFSNDL